MLKIKYFKVSLIIVILVTSCLSNKKNKHIDILTSKLSDKLLSWKLKNDTVIMEYENRLDIRIFYNDTDTNPFFLDIESNNMVTAMLGYYFYEDLKIYEIINFQLEFEGYKDIVHISLDQKKLQSNYENFNETPIFYNFVEHSFIHLGYIGVLRATQSVKNLNKIVNEIFDFKGNFWDLLYSYSKECGKIEKNQNDTYHFIFLIGELNHMDEFMGYKYNQETLKYFLNSCGYDELLLNKNPLELMEYFDN